MSAPELSIETRRVGAILLLGGALLVIGNALHPFIPLGDPQAFVEELGGGTGLWKPVHLVVGVGALVVAVGLVGLAVLVRATAAAPWGAVTALSGAIGATIVAVQIIGVDGVAIPMLVEGASTGALEAAIAIDRGLAALWILVFIGVTGVLLGITVQKIRLADLWVTVLIVAGGVLGVTAALVVILVDADSEFGINVLTRIGAGLLTLGVLALAWRLFAKPLDLPSAA